MDPDTQEALSRRYADTVVIMLPLRSGKLAVFNNARELCGFIEGGADWPPSCWVPPKKRPLAAEAKTSSALLKDLGLI